MGNKDNNNDPHRYDDMIHLPHHVSRSHPQMTILNRAAQFAPFAALTGYDDAVSETARLTDQRIDLDENRKEILDEKLQMIQEHIEKHPEVTITYFKADEKKAGGAYLTNKGYIKKIDSYEHTVVMQNGFCVFIKDIYDLQGDLFRFMDNNYE